MAIAKNSIGINEEKRNITVRWFDQVQQATAPDVEEEDPRSCEEIVSAMWKRMWGDRE